MALSFDQILELQPGDSFWENHLEMKVKTAPAMHRSKNSNFTQIAFEAEWLETGKMVNYLFTKEMMHYSPRIYTFNPYVQV